MINGIDVNECIKESCMDFLQKKIEPTNENYLKEQIEGVLKRSLRQTCNNTRL
jgi:hypothetical protein